MDDLILWILDANLVKAVISHSFGTDSPNTRVRGYYSIDVLLAIQANVDPLALIVFRDYDMK